MKKIFEKIRKIELSKGLYLLLIAAVALLKLIYVGSQRMILYPEASMLDDMLMVQAAENILEGSWLGAYNYLTIGKHMLFALWLALVSKVGISYLLAGQLLFTAASFAITESLAPAVKSRLLRLCFFTYLIMSPASYADFTLRIYRDNITVSFVLLVLAGFMGFALRLKSGSFKSLFGWSALGGFALGCSYLLREDGWWLLPFCAVAAFVCIIILIKERPKKALLRPVDKRHPEKRYADLEEELLERINALGIGPQGFGGRTTALCVNIEKCATHIAGLPVAVNLNCHVTRHQTEVI